MQTPSDEDLLLYPHEELAAREVMTTLLAKYSGRPDTKENLVALATEAENRFKEIGLRVVVDIANADVGEKGVYVAPVIEIVGRVQVEVGHDHDRHSAEVQSGMADGLVGRVTEDGVLREPKVVIPVSSTKE